MHRLYRDLSEYDIAYLFVDGIAERIRPGQRREPVMAAWGFTATGPRALLHLMAGSKEDAETVSAFFQDMRARGLGDPLLAVSDGASVGSRTGRRRDTGRTTSWPGEHVGTAEAVLRKVGPMHTWSR